MISKEQYSDIPNANFHYTVKAGDSLSRITLKYYGNTQLWKDLYSINTKVVGPNPDRISAGMELKMPKHLNTKLLIIDDLYEILPPSSGVPSAISSGRKLNLNKVMIASASALLLFTMFTMKDKKSLV